MVMSSSYLGDCSVAAPRRGNWSPSLLLQLRLQLEHHRRRVYLVLIAEHGSVRLLTRVGRGIGLAVDDWPLRPGLTAAEEAEQTWILKSPMLQTCSTIDRVTVVEDV